MNLHSTVGGPALAQQRHLVTEIPGPASRELLERRQRSVARGLSHVLPVFVTAAGGGVLIDADGNSLIDFSSGIAVTSVGNSAELVVSRITDQIAHFTHTCFMVAPYEGYVEVCEELNRITPGSYEKRSALFNSGAEAIENAVKIARHATGRQAVVVFDHAYHGRTNLTMAMTAKNMPYKDGFGPFAGEIYRAPMAYPFRWPGGPAKCAEEALDVVKGLIHAQVGEERTAAVVIEPIQGEGGFIVPPRGLPARPGRVLPRARDRVHRRRDPVRLLPHRRLVRLRARGRRARPGHHRQGHRRRAAAGRRHRPGRDHGLGARRRTRRHLRRQPGGVRRRARLDRDDDQGRPAGRCPAGGRDHGAEAAQAGRAVPGHRRHPRARRDDRDRADQAGHDRARTRRPRRRWPRPATRPA